VPCAILNGLVTLGLRAVRAQVDFAHVSLATPSAPPGYYRSIAEAAVRDLLGHFWSATPSAAGQPHLERLPRQELPDARGGMWSAARSSPALDGLYRVTGSPEVRQRIAADWKQVKARYAAGELETAGPPVHSACDDSGWTPRCTCGSTT